MAKSKDKSLIEEAIDQAVEVVDNARPAIETFVAQAKEQMATLGKDAKDAADQAREKAAPLIAEGKVAATEKAAAAAELAAAKAAEGAEKAAEIAKSSREAATAAVAGVTGEEAHKSHKIRNLVIIGSLVAAGGYVFNKLRTKSEADNWQSAYTPPPATPGSATSAGTADTAETDAEDSGASGSTSRPLAPGVGPDEPIATDDPMTRAADDAAGASPDEALADEAEEPHAVTTPDEPADTVEVAEDDAKA